MKIRNRSHIYDINLGLGKIDLGLDMNANMVNVRNA